MEEGVIMAGTLFLLQHKIHGEVISNGYMITRVITRVTCKISLTFLIITCLELKHYHNIGISILHF